MADISTSKGGKEASSVKEAAQGGTPKTGFDSAPKGKTCGGETPATYPGTNRGAS